MTRPTDQPTRPHTVSSSSGEALRPSARLSPALGRLFGGAGTNYLGETMNLAEAMLKEQKKCRELSTIYKELGPAGGFAKLMVDQALAQAESAVMSGDVVAMLKAYQELKSFKK